jgi:hypothetical protein
LSWAVKPSAIRILSSKNRVAACMSEVIATHAMVFLTGEDAGEQQIPSVLRGGGALRGIYLVTCLSAKN